MLTVIKFNGLFYIVLLDENWGAIFPSFEKRRTMYGYEWVHKGYNFSGLDENMKYVSLYTYSTKRAAMRAAKRMVSYEHPYFYKGANVTETLWGPWCVNEIKIDYIEI